MNNRCNNKDTEYYKYYGERGIKVCYRWSDKNPNGFQNFLKDMGEIPDGLTIDRIDNNGDYDKNNCKLSTMEQQCRNKRNNHLEIFNGKVQCFQDIADQNKINPQTLRNRMKRNGYSIEEALKYPVRKYKN